MTGTTKTEKYTFLYKRLLHSTHIVRQDTGEEIAIPPETETLYSYMRDQYESYQALEKPFFESQESMGRKFKGRDRRWIAARIDVLNRLGLVKSEEQERDSYGHKRYHHTVIPLEGTEGVAANLLFYGPASMSGGPLAEGMLIRELDKKKPRGTPKKKKTAQPKNEEKKGDDESDQGNAEQRDGVPDIHSDRHDDVSANDALNERYYADLDTLNNWVEGYDDEGFMAYGAMWGIAKPGAITDLIKSHIRKIQSDGYKGSRSAANDEPSGADAIYKQQQAQRAAEAKRAVNAPDDYSPPDFNDDEEF
ncbi:MULTISPECIES: DUF6945 domain-containing protein [Enterobacteriaceae]|uniref:DUF6945 domain-containing protein n=1 Tax=Enterobacteriaceae TaxID=543 RepID=UPI000B2A2749|nr:MULTISPECIES: hypothetical protein [Enterobacteriaceae]MDL4412763.1 hypothetical protein [Klebsiella variicola]MEA4227954.1 hypothetical protein [Klebsiella pneumoniae]